MTQKTLESNKKPPQNKRQERLQQALRENLMRRKQNDTETKRKGK